MAQAQTLRFGEQLLLWGDGASPTETFTPLCGFTSLELTVNIETATTNVPDCDDPELPAWLETDEVSKQMQLGGTGVIDANVLDEFNDWILTGGERTFRWLTQAENGAANGYWEGRGILTTYGQTGERGQRWNHNFAIVLNGAPTRVSLSDAPTPTVAPVVSGTPTVSEVLTVTDGTWTNSPDTYSYQWYRGSQPIAGATSGTYTLLAADEGAVIRARVTATNSSGSFTSTSNSVGPVAP